MPVSLIEGVASIVIVLLES
uniref:Uncharacterized protein n=1 Tax=Arundo donax TaxID=35708 RepID=A0A0A9C3B6_ARUDO